MGCLYPTVLYKLVGCLKLAEAGNGVEVGYGRDVPPPAQSIEPIIIIHFQHLKDTCVTGVTIVVSCFFSFLDNSASCFF